MTDLHYELRGSGPKLLFIQGVGVIGAGWGPQVEHLSKNFSTLTFDNRGIGRSPACNEPLTIERMANDARTLMDAVGWESAHVVGHSMGGVIAQQLALDSPQRVQSLSLLCTFAKGLDGARVTPKIAWLGLRTRIGTRKMRRRAFLEILLPPDPLRDADTDTLAKNYAPLIGRDLSDNPPILMQQLKALGCHNCSSRLGELRMPTLVVSAEHDPIALPAYGQELARLIPGARFELLTGVSHGVVLHRPELINEKLEAFFRSTMH